MQRRLHLGHRWPRSAEWPPPGAARPALCARSIAARHAAHLRAVVERLRARGPSAAPMFAGPVLASVLPRAVLSVWADVPRSRLGLSSVDALLGHAARMEAAHGLAAQPPLWLAPPSGGLRVVAWNLWQTARSHRGWPLVAAVWDAGEISVDLTWPSGGEAAFAPPLRSAVQGLRGQLAAAGARLGHAWTEARLTILDRCAACHPDDTFARVVLETAAPLHRAHVWMSDDHDVVVGTTARWLPPSWWPDLPPDALSAAERATLGWF